MTDAADDAGTDLGLDELVALLRSPQSPSSTLPCDGWPPAPESHDFGAPSHQHQDQLQRQAPVAAAAQVCGTAQQLPPHSLPLHFNESDSLLQLPGHSSMLLAADCTSAAAASVAGGGVGGGVWPAVGANVAPFPFPTPPSSAAQSIPTTAVGATWSVPNAADELRRRCQEAIALDSKPEGHVGAVLVWLSSPAGSAARDALPKTWDPATDRVDFRCHRGYPEGSRVNAGGRFTVRQLPRGAGPDGRDWCVVKSFFNHCTGCKAKSKCDCNQGWTVHMYRLLSKTPPAVAEGGEAPKGKVRAFGSGAEKVELWVPADIRSTGIFGFWTKPLGPTAAGAAGAASNPPTAAASPAAGAEAGGGAAEGLEVPFSGLTIAPGPMTALLLSCAAGAGLPLASPPVAGGMAAGGGVASRRVERPAKRVRTSGGASGTRANGARGGSGSGGVQAGDGDGGAAAGTAPKRRRISAPPKTDTRAEEDAAGTVAVQTQLHALPTVTTSARRTSATAPPPAAVPPTAAPLPAAPASAMPGAAVQGSQLAAPPGTAAAAHAAVAPPPGQQADALAERISTLLQQASLHNSTDSQALLSEWRALLCSVEPGALVRVRSPTGQCLAHWLVLPASRLGASRWAQPPEVTHPDQGLPEEVILALMQATIERLGRRRWQQLLEVQEAVHSATPVVVACHFGDRLRVLDLLLRTASRRALLLPTEHYWLGYHTAFRLGHVAAGRMHLKEVLRVGEELAAESAEEPRACIDDEADAPDAGAVSRCTTCCSARARGTAPLSKARARCDAPEA